MRKSPYSIPRSSLHTRDDTMSEKKAPQDIGDEKPEALHREDTLGDAKQQQLPRDGDYSGARKKTDPAEIRLVRKLDMWIMPILWLMYWLNYLDRNAIALARLNDLEEDLNLSSSQYQTCVSILFVGYILGQVPSSKCFGNMENALALTPG